MHTAPQNVKKDRRHFTTAWLPVNGKPRRYKVEGGTLIERYNLIFLLHWMDEMIAEFNMGMSS